MFIFMYSAQKELGYRKQRAQATFQHYAFSGFTLAFRFDPDYPKHWLSLQGESGGCTKLPVTCVACIQFLFNVLISWWTRLTSLTIFSILPPQTIYDFPYPQSPTSLCGYYWPSWPFLPLINQ